MNVRESSDDYPATDRAKAKQMNKKYITSAVVRLANERLQRLEQIRRSMLAAIESEREQILESNLDLKTNDGLLADEYPFLQDAEEMIGGLLIVGLYGVVEHFTKQLLRHRYPPNKVEQFYRMETLQEALARDCDVNLSIMPEFAAIDDLRRRNNAVKHGGLDREPTLEAYERLQTTVVPYLERIGLIIVP